MPNSPPPIARRLPRFLLVPLAATGVAYGVAGVATAVSEAAEPEPGTDCGVSDEGVASCPFPAAPPRAEAALSTLVRGNERFVSGTLRHPNTGAAVRARLEQGQRPFATIVGCSDSRVPPEVIFDEGLGDLFVIRVAGNVNDSDVTASVQYAVQHLETPLLVVMGHEHCGAVTAAVQHVRGELDARQEPPEILSLLDRIETGLPRTEQLLHGPLAHGVHQAVEDNVRHTMAELGRVPSLARAVAAGHLLIVGAIYDMHTGAVRYLDTPDPASTQAVP